MSSSSSFQGLFKSSRTLMAALTKTTKTTKTTVSKTLVDPPKPKKTRTKAVTKAPQEESKGKKPGSSNTGILKVCPVSVPMQEFLGVPEASRTHAVKKVWEYIKLHDLQAQTDKRVILCDDKLKTIFEGKEKVGFLEIGKLLSGHFVKTKI